MQKGMGLIQRGTFQCKGVMNFYPGLKSYPGQKSYPKSRINPAFLFQCRWGLSYHIMGQIVSLEQRHSLLMAFIFSTMPGSSLPETEVIHRKPKNGKAKFGVCVKAIQYDNKYAAFKLAEWIEIIGEFYSRASNGV